MSKRQFQMPHLSLGKLLDCKRVLIIVCVVILAIVAFRFYHMSLTGYMLPDELFYYEVIVLDHQIIERRWIFSVIYSLFFGGVTNVSSLPLVGAVYASVWGVGSAFLSYMTTQRLGMIDEHTKLLLASLLLFPIYTIMIPLVLTETMGLFFVFVGIFFAIGFQRRGKWLDALFSSLAFVAAYRVREPYLLFSLVNLVGILASEKRSVRSLVAYAIPLALVLPIPTSVWPPRFASLDGFLLNSWFGQSLWRPLQPHARGVGSIGNRLQGRYLSSFLYAIGIGLFFGYNPLFAVLALVSILLSIRFVLRRPTAARLPAWNALAGLGAYAGTLFFGAGLGRGAGLFPVWISTAIRASHVSLPVAFTFGQSYSRIGTKKVIAISLILIVIGSTQLPILAQAVQTRLNRAGGIVDRLSLEYRAPYYRLYELAKNSGTTLAFTGNTRGVRTYFSMLPNAEVQRIPRNESAFEALLAEGWDTIYLYDQYRTVANPSSIERYPQYYKEIVLTRSYEGYTIEPLWIDAESYAFKMSPLESTNA